MMTGMPLHKTLSICAAYSQQLNTPDETEALEEAHVCRDKLEEYRSIPRTTSQINASHSIDDLKQLERDVAYCPWGLQHLQDGQHPVRRDQL